MLYFFQLCLRESIKYRTATQKAYYRYGLSFATIKTRSQNDKGLQSKDLFQNTYDNQSMLNQLLSQNINTTILNFPYTYIPLSIIQNYQQIQSDKQSLKDLIAFRCLSNIKEEQLRQAMDILLPSQNYFRKINVNRFEGQRQIFTAYFNRKHQELKQAYKNGTVEQKIKYLAVLNNYQLNNQTSELVKQINANELIDWDTSGIGLTYYLQLLVKNRLPYEHLFSNITAKLKDQTIPDSQKTKICLSILTLPRFYKLFPPDFSDSLFPVISKQIQQMDNYQLLLILRFAYEYTSPASIGFCKGLLSHICSINPSKVPGKEIFLLELILKSIKYANVLKIDIEPTLNILLNKKQDLLPLFQYIPCLHFHTLLFVWQRQSNQPEQLVKIKEHIRNSIKQYAESKAVKQQQLRKLFELVLRYWKKLSQEQKQVIKLSTLSILKQHKLEIAYIYQCLKVLLQEKNQQFLTEEGKLIMSQALKNYFQSTCRRNNIGHLQIKSNIEQNILLITLITKNKFALIQSLPQLENYNFDYTNMISLNCLERIIEFLNTNQSMKAHQINSILAKIQQIIIYYINKKCVPFKTLISIIQICSKAKYQRKQIFERIQKAIYETLKKFPNFTIMKPDLYIIKDHMIKANHGTLGFQEMIYEAIASPSNWKMIRKKFVDNEDKHWNMVDEKKKKRSNG